VSVRNPGSSRLVITLGSTGLVAGLVLAGVFIGTKPAIERNRAAALRAAISALFPETATFTGLEPEGGALAVRTAEGPPRPGTVVYRVLAEDGTALGFAVPAEGPGYMDTVGLIYGYDPARRVIVGVEILDSRETPGLGDKIISDDRFHENFVALEIEPEIVAVKRGKKTRPNEVDCITGATISSEAVVAILGRSVERWRPLLEKPTNAGPGAGVSQ